MDSFGDVTSGDLAALIHKCSELEAGKRALLDAKTLLDQEIKQLHAQILEVHKQTHQERFEIPSEDVAKQGFFHVSLKSDYESLTKPCLQKLCIAFHDSLAQSEHDKSTAREFAIGEAEWIWSHRGKTSTQRVTCVRNADEKKPASEARMPRKRQRALPVSDGAPRTAEDFVAHEHLASMEELE